MSTYKVCCYSVSKGHDFCRMTSHSSNSVANSDVSEQEQHVSQEWEGLPTIGALARQLANNLAPSDTVQFTASEIRRVKSSFDYVPKE